jgi:HKD family nuclease
MKQAADRGVLMRILLDPNKDAFGRKKNGIPNRSVAYELIEHSGNIGIRWCDTHGEQCHTKMLIVESKDSYKLILGSANLTRRNIGGYNLETNVIISNDTEFKAMTDAKRYFEKVWNNEGGKIYSTQYSTYKDDSYEKTILYRLMEDLGTSSF